MFKNWKRKYDQACVNYNGMIDEQKGIIRARDAEIKKLKTKVVDLETALAAATAPKVEAPKVEAQKPKPKRPRAKK